MRYLVGDVTGKTVSGRHGGLRCALQEALGAQLGVGDAELLQRLAAVVDDVKGELDALAGGCVGITAATHQGAARNFTQEWATVVVVGSSVLRTLM